MSVGENRKSEAPMVAKLVELRVRRMDDLRRWWLSGYPDGGVFLPEVTHLPVGTQVLVEVLTTESIQGSLMLLGTVVWLQPRCRHEGAERALPTGTGVRFAFSMHEQVRFLQRMWQGEANESRRGVRIPAQFSGEVIAATGVFDAEVRDVSPRGLRMRAKSVGEMEVDAPIAVMIRREEEVASLFANVAWVDPKKGEFGVCLALGTPRAREQWSRVLTQQGNAEVFGAFQ
jgi:Tfp pilus assembly protein PilZ